VMEVIRGNGPAGNRMGSMDCVDLVLRKWSGGAVGSEERSNEPWAFRKMREHELADHISDSQEGVCFTELRIVAAAGAPPPSPNAMDFVVPSRLWLKCNQLLRLGRPSGAVTLSR
jgi:hypothetical protein